MDRNRQCRVFLPVSGDREPAGIRSVSGGWKMVQASGSLNALLLFWIPIRVRKPGGRGIPHQYNPIPEVI